VERWLRNISFLLIVLVSTGLILGNTDRGIRKSRHNWMYFGFSLNSCNGGDSSLLGIQVGYSYMLKSILLSVQGHGMLDLSNADLTQGELSLLVGLATKPGQIYASLSTGISIISIAKMNYVKTKGVNEIRNTVSVGLPIVLQVHLKVFKIASKKLEVYTSIFGNINGVRSWSGGSFGFCIRYN